MAADAGTNGQALREARLVFLASLAVLLLAFVAEQAFVPDIEPIALEQTPQPLWAVEVAFLLHTIALAAGFVAGFALLLLAVLGARALIRPQDRRRIAGRRRHSGLT
ncbi:MAG TPA: hypothetical protein VK438_04435 [Xanthobacteraceae bacterium]|nr:hypothetical protein [Xanthobacteraceae bacterium]